MVNYLNSSKKHMFDIPNVSFKLYNDIIVPNLVHLDPWSNIKVVEAYFRLSKKVSMI